MKIRNFSFLVSGVAALALSAAAFATGSTTLILTVSGAIASAPEWRNALNATISVADFSFSNNVAGDAARNIDSSETQVRLFNATTYPASVELVRPTNCKIGTSSVDNAHVHFMNNGSAITVDGDFDINDNALQSYKVRFASAGNYGDKSGAVTCDSGAIIYAY